MKQDELAARILAGHEENAATALVHSWDVARLRIEEAGGLVTRADIAKAWGKSVQAVGYLARQHDDFPQPVGGRANAPVYLRDEVNYWRTVRGLDR